MAATSMQFREAPGDIFSSFALSIADCTNRPRCGIQRTTMSCLPFPFPPIRRCEHFIFICPARTFCNFICPTFFFKHLPEGTHVFMGLLIHQGLLLLGGKTAMDNKTGLRFSVVKCNLFPYSTGQIPSWLDFKINVHLMIDRPSWQSRRLCCNEAVKALIKRVWRRGTCI